MELKPGTKFLKMILPDVFFPQKDKNGNTYFAGSIKIFVQEKKEKVEQPKQETVTNGL